MRSVRPQALTALAGCVVMLGVGAAQAQSIKVVFSNLAGDPSNTVPGLSNGWRAGVTTQFDRPFLSPDGSRWVIGGFANEAASADRVIVAGSGTTRAGATLVLQEGPFALEAGRNYSFVDTELSINDSGQVAFVADLDGSTTNDEVLCTVNVDGTGLTLIAREDQPEPTGLFPGNFIGVTIDSPTITNDGRVGFKTLLDGPGTALPVAPLTANNNDFLFLASTGGGLTTIAQEGVTPVSPGGPIWDLFDAGDFYVSADGSRWIAQGNDEGPTTSDQVGVYFDGTTSAAVIREGSSIYAPGVVSTGGAAEMFMSRNGAHWIANGSNTTSDTNDWVVFNGTRVAGTDEDITPNNTTDPAEAFDDAIFTTTFFSIAVNNAGDYIVAGTTNNPNADTNAVIVLNGSRVVVREGDPVDVNDDGLPNDNVRVSVFNNFDLFLTDDRKLFFMADLRNDAGIALNSQAFLVIDLGATPGPTCDSTDFNQDGDFPTPLDLEDFINANAGNVCSTCSNDLDFNNDGDFPTPLDVEAFISVLGGGPCL